MYDIIIDCDFNDSKIVNRIKERIKLIKVRGIEFGWNVVDKSKKKLKPVDLKPEALKAESYKTKYNKNDKCKIKLIIKNRH